jgi:hypothetical protein
LHYRGAAALRTLIADFEMYLVWAVLMLAKVARISTLLFIGSIK